jgi:hypothetical protein
MQTGNHTAVLLSHVLAPGPSKTPAISAMRYATETWSPRAIVLLAVIVMVALVLIRLAGLAGRRQQ